MLFLLCDEHHLDYNLFMKLLKSNLLTPFKNLTHAFSTRYGGYSKTPYFSNNLAFHVGDNKNRVLKNHKKLSYRLKYSYKKLIHMKQIHSDIVHIVEKKDNFFNPKECDALITDKLYTPIMIMSADCTPVIIYDSLLHVIAVVHVGRAGAFKNIISKTVSKMSKHFSSKTDSLHVSLGASIHECCYEINSTIANKAKELGFEDMLSYRDKKIFLSVNSIIKKQLYDIGIRKIDEIQKCTSCNNDTFFSYRADKQITGRISAVAMLH
jgi:YfiH family protein